ncbi:uncharacterized protein LOC143027650 [Oratosquilla oratoria]|uniref:uncharacterized protein LOC143027650 n=1 Tax=Oratosquilla oratoria TaxID=337810 RepID=UPI003F76499A
MAVLLLALLVGSATWANTPVSDSGEHPVTPESPFIDVTCTPVEEDGLIKCHPSTDLPNNLILHAAPWYNVTCRVKMILDNFNLTNECQEVANNPYRIRCTATIPRHRKDITYCYIHEEPVSSHIATTSPPEVNFTPPPVSDSGEHPVTPESPFINVTCTPVEVDGRIKCLPSTYLPHKLNVYAEPWDRVTCGISLHLHNFSLTNECQEVADNPDLIRCTATVPRHLKQIITCDVYAATAGGVKPILASTHFCDGLCARHSREVGCVIDEGCRLCVEDLRKYLPQYANDPSVCEYGFPTFVPE